MTSTGGQLEALLAEVDRCTLCDAHLPHGCRPVVQVGKGARILIAGQAPGRRVHESGVPFDDPSGDRLRDWMDLDRETFYDPETISILPMGFCYPGTGKHGDLPPRPECAPTWREAILKQLTSVELTLVVGGHAQKWHLPEPATSVTEAVSDWRRSWPSVLPLPHPSPRNRAWLKKNPWFERDVIPQLRKRVTTLLESDPHR